MTFSDLPAFLKYAYIFAWILIVVHVLMLSVVAYWQLFDPTNLTFKAWMKAPLHLSVFDSTGVAVAFFVVLWVAQLICLFLYASLLSEPGKKAYYLVFGLVVVGIWTYLLVPALLLLALMLSQESLQHFGLRSFEDLF
jgi:hypothetical protein